MSEHFCTDCVDWIPDYDDGAVGLCNNPKSDHHQQLVRRRRLACKHLITKQDAEDWEWQQAPAWRAKK